MLPTQMLGVIFVTNIGIQTHDSLIFYLKHKSDLTSHWHYQVKLNGRGLVGVTNAHHWGLNS
jgi:hypothetical protein